MSQSKSGTWVVAGVGLLAGGMSVLAAFGAFIPPLGEVFGTAGEGAGSFFGFLLGACFWGGIGLLALRSARKEHAKQAVPETASASFTPSGAVVPLEPGPGMGWRWAMAVPVMFLAVIGPWTGSIVVSIWWQRDFFAGFTDEEPFWSEFAETIGDTWPALALPSVTIAVYLLLRGQTIATWPKACVILSLFVVGPAALFAMVGQDRFWQNLPGLLFCAGLVWASWEFGRAAVGLLTRPIALDVVRSSVEIPVPLAEDAARLRVQRIGLVVDKLPGADRKKRVTLSLGNITSVCMTEVDTPRTSPLPAGVEIDLPAGSAVRITAKKSEWLLPVDETTGQYLVSAITDRAARLRNKS